MRHIALQAALWLSSRQAHRRGGCLAARNGAGHDGSRTVSHGKGASPLHDRAEEALNSAWGEARVDRYLGALSFASWNTARRTAGTEKSEAGDRKRIAAGLSSRRVGTELP